MSVRVRLTRVGSKRNPIWRVVVADKRSPRDGRFIESIGHYNPQTDPSTIVIDRDRLEHWIERGAQPSPTVRKLMRAPNSAAAAPAPGVAEEPAQAEAPEPGAEDAAPAADAADAADAATPEAVGEPVAEDGEPVVEGAAPDAEAAAPDAEVGDSDAAAGSEGAPPAG